MKTIGIVGGMGQWATLDILNRIFRASVDYPVPQYGNRGYPKMYVAFVNRAPMILNLDGSYPDKLEPSETLLETAELVGKNSDFVIIASNTAHIFIKQIAEKAEKEIVSLVDLSVSEAVKRKCKKVGVLAIGITLREKLFQNALKEHGIEPVILPEELENKLDKRAIYPLQEGEELQNIPKIALESIEYLRTQNVDSIILGCTELPILLDDEADETDIINPSQLVAETAIKKAL